MKKGYIMLISHRISLCWLSLFTLSLSCLMANERPNVLFISIDDLNDWSGFMGNDQAITPNLDRLASKSVVFDRAYCASPACNPSRAATLFGIDPNVSGLYYNKLQSEFRKSSLLKNEPSLPQWFKKHGYYALGSGKVFHKVADPVSWNEYFPPLDSKKGKNRPSDAFPPKDQINEMKIGNIDMGALDIDDSDMSDWQVADHIVKQLKKKRKKPFFMGFGLFRPHLPLYAPRSYFDKFPLDQIQLPEVQDRDLEDVPPIGRAFARQHGLDKVLKEGGQEGWKKVVQAYLACTTFADTCLGMVLDALESSPHRDNTIIVLWSDHGWHLGEKEHIQKFTLWERGTKSNLMIYAPDVTHKAGARYAHPVSLVDIFPTVCELAKVPLKSSLTGESLVPYFKNPTKVKTSPVLTTWEPGNFAIRTLDYRYIRYSDGEEELYDHRNDSHEFKNLAKSPEYANILKQHRTHLPSNSVEPNPPVSKSALKKEEHKKKKLAKLVERSLKK